MQAASGSGGANGGRRTAPGCSEAGSPERGLAPVPLPPPVQCESSASPPTGAERPVLGRPPWTRRTTDAAALAARIARSPPFTPPTSPDDLRSAARRGRASFWSCSAIPAAPIYEAARSAALCRSQSACSRIQNWGDVFSSHLRQPQGRIRRDPALAEHDFVEAIRGDPQLLRGLGLPEPQRLEEFFEQHLPGWDRRSRPIRISSDSLRLRPRGHGRSPTER